MLRLHKLYLQRLVNTKIPAQEVTAFGRTLDMRELTLGKVIGEYFSDPTYIQRPLLLPATQ